MTETAPLYVAARRALLDALRALDRHRDAIILVGAQAIYLHAGSADLDRSVAPYTTDADLSIDTERLGPDPRIGEAMINAGFDLKLKSAGGGVEPGTWLTSAQVDGQRVHIPVDLLVPKAMAPQRGRRDARLPDHGQHATRWAAGLEATIRDNDERTIVSLEPNVDDRTAVIRVAGPAALLIAKVHKLAERLQDRERGRSQRVRPKDAGDVLRLMRGSKPPAQVGDRLRILARDEMCGPSVRDGVDHLDRLFGRSRAAGVDLAVEAVAGAMPEVLVRGLAPAYISDLLAAYRA